MSEAILETAQEAARCAGEVLLRRFQECPAIRATSKGDRDIVTEADHAAEHSALAVVRGRFPSHRVVCEESGTAGLASEYVWFIDALDGTKNFVRGNPSWSVSIGVEAQGTPLAGVVFDPVRNEMFSALSGAGFLLNGRQERVSETDRVERSLIATGFPSGKRHRFLDPSIFATVALASMGFRRSGSSALDLAHVASGRLDALWDLGLCSWDVSAGLLMVQEAGGMVSDLAGAPWTNQSTHVLASNGRIHGELAALFSDWVQRTVNTNITG